LFDFFSSKLTPLTNKVLDSNAVLNNKTKSDLEYFRGARFDKNGFLAGYY
jgi:hypothetical protein